MSIRESSEIKLYEVQARNPALLTVLLYIWERSVRATHRFLSQPEIENIKKYVPQAMESVEHLIVAADESGKPVAFMGVTGLRLEMLFVAPEARGTGIGKRLLLHGIGNHGVREVTVNEQNPQAIGFYKHMGFKTYQRTDFDEEGNPYPLLYMKLM